jgi:hypothetical protein
MMPAKPRARLAIGGVAVALLAAVVVFSGACPSSPVAGVEPVDAQLGEVAWPDEAALTQRIADALRASVADDYPAEHRPARRDAHPKAHGCVRAEFRVEADLPAHLTRGVFAPGATYPAWIRFSNGDGDANRADLLGDARGMAIKLMGIPGEKLLATERDATTQDFILISNPRFFADDPGSYVRLIERATSTNRLVQATAPLALGWKGLWIAREMTAKQISSPLETRYWSTVPFSLGAGADRVAVKYSARPCAPGSSSIPDDPSPDYLREAMVRALAVGDACFEFLVQPRAGDWMSVEDPRIEWTEGEAPFTKVATLTIPRQVFSTTAQDSFCEDLSFTPWHSLPEHRPLGGMNRVRRVVYEAISELRHELNGAARAEPSGDEVFP